MSVVRDTREQERNFFSPFHLKRLPFFRADSFTAAERRTNFFLPFAQTWLTPDHFRVTRRRSESSLKWFWVTYFHVRLVRDNSCEACSFNASTIFSENSEWLNGIQYELFFRSCQSHNIIRAVSIQSEIIKAWRTSNQGPLLQKHISCVAYQKSWM